MSRLSDAVSGALAAMQEARDHTVELIVEAEQTGEYPARAVEIRDALNNAMDTLERAWES